MAVSYRSAQSPFSLLSFINSCNCHCNDRTEKKKTKTKSEQFHKPNLRTPNCLEMSIANIKECGGDLHFIKNIYSMGNKRDKKLLNS